MQEITFDGLGLRLEISRIAFKVFNIEIYWYAIIITIAILISIILYKKNENLYNIKYECVIDLIILLIPIGFIGARIYYCLFNLEYYKENVIEIFKIQNGGLAIYGGIISSVILVYYFCKRKKIDFINMLDFLSINIPLAQSIGRWGNFFNIEAYGIETKNVIRMGIIENGIYKEVHPTFLYESVGTLIIFIILNLLKRKRKFKGQIVDVYLVLYSTIRFCIEGLRVDSLMLGEFKISQIISLILFFIGSAGIYKNLKRKNSSILR